MKQHKIAALVLSLTFLGISNAAAEEVERRVDAQAKGRVDISNLSGSIEVYGWSRNQVEVTGTIGDDVEELIVENSGRQTTIKVKLPDRKWGRSDSSAHLVIRVPVGSSLEVATVSANIDVEGVRGEQDLQSVSGNIATEGFASDVDAETVSGDVDVTGDNKEAEWDLSSVSGDINAENLGGDVDAEVVSGDIEIEGGSFDRVDLETVNGDMLFNGALRSGAKLDAETVNGSVEVELQGRVSAKFDIETFNGKIRNCFGQKAERTSKYAPGWELSFTEGNGDARVTINSLNGSIRVCND